MAKRLFDLLLIGLTLPFWLPVLAVTALAALLFGGRPLFFRQERAGLGGKSFWLWKFRTMREGEGSDAERLTRFGRFLRATSLDELPQLFSVLKGEMSLVGPRPLPVRYLPRYTAEERRRHEVLPGITGLAQVNGRNTLTWEEKFAWDVKYVETHTLMGDVRILLATGLKVFAAKGIAATGEATMSEFRPPKGERT